MKIVHTDENTVQFVDGAGISFMALMVHELNNALKENGIKKAEKRQEICASFLFNFAYNVDAGWFVQEGKKLFPKVCLAERANPKEDENLGLITLLHIPAEATSWHEYAHGVVARYFEEDGESVPDISTGSYDNEN